MASSSSGGPSSIPRDALVMAAILKEMGVADYEPRVINLMLEFAYKYVSDVFEEAKAMSEHANKREIDASDVKLAVKTLVNHSFTTPPPRDFLMEIAREKNSQKLPIIPEKFGLRLPPDRHCLLAPNHKIKPRKKAKPQLAPLSVQQATQQAQGQFVKGISVAGVGTPSSIRFITTASGPGTPILLATPIVMTTPTGAPKVLSTTLTQRPILSSQLQQPQQQQGIKRKREESGE
ncbi:transcription initiation factor TFIID subunit 9B-like [Oscarella lobularis]|uniref:transcription initiation factor TFIID subunit 9B-like n=1 Tax=Oscarella lobularis TaxID=121494 RepID=UPI003313962E